MSEGDLKNARGKSERAIARARAALRSTLDGRDPRSSVFGTGDSGEGSGGPGEGEKTGIELVSGRPGPIIGGGVGSESLSGGSQGVDARRRADERRTRVRNSGDGQIRSGINPENIGSESGPTSGEHDASGNAPSSSEEKDEALLKLPPEAYFQDGSLKKSWSDKLNGIKKSHHSKNEAKPSALVKKKGISFTGDKELNAQVTAGIQLIFQAVDLMSDYGLGVADVWDLDEDEAAVFTRILLKRADKGDKKALKTISVISGNMDLVQAATIVIPRIGVTFKEVAANGIRPRFTRRRSKKSVIPNPAENPGNV